MHPRRPRPNDPTLVIRGICILTDEGGICREWPDSDELKRLANVLRDAAEQARQNELDEARRYLRFLEVLSDDDFAKELSNELVHGHSSHPFYDEHIEFERKRRAKSPGPKQLPAVPLEDALPDCPF